jgi:hypothetical protein
LKAQYREAGSLTELKQKIMTAVGKPLPEADIEVIESASFIDYFCEIAPEVLKPSSRLGKLPSPAPLQIRTCPTRTSGSSATQFRYVATGACTTRTAGSG